MPFPDFADPESKTSTTEASLEPPIFQGYHCSTFTWLCMLNTWISYAEFYSSSLYWAVSDCEALHGNKAKWERWFLSLIKWDFNLLIVSPRFQGEKWTLCTLTVISLMFPQQFSEKLQGKGENTVLFGLLSWNTIDHKISGRIYTLQLHPPEGQVLHEF